MSPRDALPEPIRLAFIAPRSALGSYADVVEFADEQRRVGPPRRAKLWRQVCRGLRAGLKAGDIGKCEATLVRCRHMLIGRLALVTWMPRQPLSELFRRHAGFRSGVPWYPGLPTLEQPQTMRVRTAPMPAIEPSSVSPRTVAPTPSGVPVKMMSPGASPTKPDR